MRPFDKLITGNLHSERNLPQKENEITFLLTFSITMTGSDSSSSITVSVLSVTSVAFVEFVEFVVFEVFVAFVAFVEFVVFVEFIAFPVYELLLYYGSSSSSITQSFNNNLAPPKPKTNVYLSLFIVNDPFFINLFFFCNSENKMVFSCYSSIFENL